ncbi:hypothetical protein [Sigmofec virus UA08Rod_5397]|uniref:Uncharacterized protein n=1 Tax=Sigmofec virus UA08Rod_5397 TaxID=2929423 RepID=A0A976N1H3_9VIRU|nr:hypothetical protein [Sigmofec virus UA08Rod_5397]
MHLNLLEQDVFFRDSCPVEFDNRDYLQDTYSEVERVSTDCGFRDELVERPYEITPDYVNSFADSCDYRVDPLNASRCSGRNLGDLTGIQDLLGDDSSALRARISELQTILNERLDPLSKKVEDKTESEVNK